MTVMVSRTDGRTISVHQEHEFLKKMEAAGLAQVVQRVIDSKDNELAKKMVRLAENGGFEPTTSQKRAREIMGRNFFGIEEAIKHLGVNPTREQLAILSEVPYSEAMLEQCKDTHVLVAVFQLSLLGVRGKAQGKRLFYDQSWFNQEPFAQERGEVTWRLVRKTPVANSFSKSWPDQQSLLAKEDKVPTARVMIYTIIGHFLATGERLFERCYVRTSSLASIGVHVSVGYFDSDGLRVDIWFDDGASGFLGLAAAREVQS